jgi:hypothetical protein
MDPGPAVEQLTGLTLVEQLLISQVTTTMSIFRLPRGGQYGFRGHVINFPQKIDHFVSNLPRSVQQLDILVLRKGQNDPMLPPTLFTVNRQRVLNALTWLKEHNQFYRNIQISHENLQALPENGILQLSADNYTQDVPDDEHDANQQPPHHPLAQPQPINPYQANNHPPSSR